MRQAATKRLVLAYIGFRQADFGRLLLQVAFLLLAGQNCFVQDPVYFFSKNDPFYEFSNFFPQGFEEGGVYWRTVEHYFQAMKFPDSADAPYREEIRLARSPKHAKSLGQTRGRPLRTDWEDVKERVMLHALRQKFSHPRLRELLLSTQDRPLVEASPHDHYWGAGSHGSGANRLGILLQQVRQELRGAASDGEPSGGPK